MDLTLLYLFSFGLILLVNGYYLTFISNKAVAKTVAWLIVITTVPYVLIITSEESSLYRMLAIVSLQLLAMKGVVMVESYPLRTNLNFIQWCAFSLGWFGMRPALFEKLPSRSLSYLQLVIKGISEILVGLLLLYSSTVVEASSIKIFFVSELLLLVSLSLILHFGVLNLFTAAWRLAGVDVRELFRSPYKSKSLKEFWGRRWNIAFSEMTSLVAYKPLKHRVSPEIAMVLSFLLSGLLHEIAISFPVNSGYGLPLLYFLVHGVLMYAENTLSFVKRIINDKILSHIWVLGWLILPIPLLFHTKFIELVLKPLRTEILLLIFG